MADSDSDIEPLYFMHSTPDLEISDDEEDVEMERRYTPPLYQPEPEPDIWEKLVTMTIYGTGLIFVGGIIEKMIRR